MSTIERQMKPGEKPFVCALFLFSLTSLVLSYQISGIQSLSAPGALPVLASLILTTCACVIVVNTFRLPATDTTTRFSSEVMPSVVWVFLVMATTYVLILDIVGFVIASAAFLVTAIYYLYRQGPLLAFFISVNSLAVVYIVFRLVFKVILPEGGLWQ